MLQVPCFTASIEAYMYATLQTVNLFYFFQLTLENLILKSFTYFKVDTISETILLNHMWFIGQVTYAFIPQQYDDNRLHTLDKNKLQNDFIFFNLKYNRGSHRQSGPWKTTVWSVQTKSS